MASTRMDVDFTKLFHWQCSADSKCHIMRLREVKYYWSEFFLNSMRQFYWTLNSVCSFTLLAVKRVNEKH